MVDEGGGYGEACNGCVLELRFGGGGIGRGEGGGGTKEEDQGSEKGKGNIEGTWPILCLRLNGYMVPCIYSPESLSL